MGLFRASAVLTAFFVFTVPLMPVQALLLRLAPAAARRFPHWYHRNVCRILGITLVIEGRVAENTPVLLVANHTSWLDIPVLSALAPVSFVAKKEVGGWPFVASLARLQQSVFIDRSRRQATADATDEITARLERGDTIVLFAEGTTSDGNRLLPFKSSLFGAIKSSANGNGAADDHDVITAARDAGGPSVQTAAVVYTHRYGVPLTRAERPTVAWYGDMKMQTHAWSVLKSGPLTVTICVGPPVPLADFADRKALAMTSERAVRRAVISVLRGRTDDPALIAVEPPAEKRRATGAVIRPPTEKWT